MKWNKLLWLSSLAAAVEESRRRKERGRLHAHETAHYTKKKKKTFTHTNLPLLGIAQVCIYP